MLALTEVCPWCGDVHTPDRVLGISLGSSRGCPNVVMGAIPTMEASEQPHDSFGQIEESALVYPGALPTASRRSDLSIWWPMPREE